MRHQSADFVVVAADKSGPFVTGDTAVGNNYRDACPISSRHSRLYLLRLIGADYQQIHTLFDKTIDLGTLQLIAAVGNTARERHVRMEQQLPLHLIVHLLPPGIIQTLAYADAVLRRTRVTTRH